MLDLSIFEKILEPFHLHHGRWRRSPCRKPLVEEFEVFSAQNCRPDVKKFKIVHLMSKNSKSSTWCQKIQNGHLMSKNSKLPTWWQKVQNCPPDVKKFKIIHLMSKKSILSTWCQKIQNCPPDVHNTEILGTHNPSRHPTWTVIPMHYWLFVMIIIHPSILSSRGRV